MNRVKLGKFLCYSLNDYLRYPLRDSLWSFLGDSLWNSLEILSGRIPMNRVRLGGSVRVCFWELLRKSLLSSFESSLERFVRGDYFWYFIRSPIRDSLSVSLEKHPNE